MKLSPHNETAEKMREILFRGKRVDNGECVYGYYYESKISGCFILSPKIKVRKKDGVVIKDSFEVAEVFPETVGQYTGLTDKNGKKIFEGDIIKAITLDTGMECLAVVCFGNFIDENNGDEYIGFYIEFDGIKTTAAQLAMKECKNRIEVIGNIYDNPELLKVE